MKFDIYFIFIDANVKNDSQNEERSRVQVFKEIYDVLLVWNYSPHWVHWNNLW